jgi:hypothetical protein
MVKGEPEMIRSLEDAQQELGPHAPLIYRAIEKALAEFMDNHALLRYRYSARTEASIIHDLMVAHLRQDLDGIPGIGFRVKRNLFLVGVDGKWTIRVKKLDRKLMSSNIMTQQVMDFLTQVQLRIPGVDEPTNLQAGYQRQGAQVTDSPVWLTCPNGQRVEWAWRLEGAAADTSPIVVPIPQAPVSPVRPVAPRVRPRIAAEKKDTPPAEAEADARAK